MQKERCPMATSLDRKLGQIAKLFERLQPNTFGESASIWDELEKSLLRCSLQTLKALNLVVLCQRDDR